MYVIGNSLCDYITLTTTTMICGCDVWDEIVKVEYDVPLHEATLIVNREDAEKILKEIRNRVNKIQFQNISILGELIDRNGSFDKTEFVKKLKIYELIPREVTEPEYLI